MFNSPSQSFFDQLRKVLKDAIDYFQSVVTLLQARAAEMALSSVVFVLLMCVATVLALASFLLLNIAFGVWLSHVLGAPGYSVLALSIVYALLAMTLGLIAMRWLKKLKS